MSSVKFLLFCALCSIVAMMPSCRAQLDNAADMKPDALAGVCDGGKIVDTICYICQERCEVVIDRNATNPCTCDCESQEQTGSCKATKLSQTIVEQLARE
jgi:hypothetical protein